MPDLRLGNVFQLPSRRISRRWTRSGTNLVIILVPNSLRASSPISASEASLARTRERGSAPRGFAARSRVLARPVSLAQTGELARRLRAK